MIDFVPLALRLRPYKVQREEDMPMAYRRPDGRFLHGDWPWPFSRIPRMFNAFRAPLPFHPLALWGASWKPRRMPWQDGYPMAPAAGYDPETKTVEAYDPVPTVTPEEPYRAGLFGAYLGDKWIPAFYTECRLVKVPLLGWRREHRNYGLKPDLTLGDFMCWAEGSLSFIPFEAS